MQHRNLRHPSPLKYSNVFYGWPLSKKTNFLPNHVSLVISVFLVFIVWLRLISIFRKENQTSILILGPVCPRDCTYFSLSWQELNLYKWRKCELVYIIKNQPVIYKKCRKILLFCLYCHSQFIWNKVHSFFIRCLSRQL